MKLYHFPGAPSPRKVGIVISEKGLDIPTEILNIRAGGASHRGTTRPSIRT